MRSILVFVSLLLVWLPASARAASPDDNARFLAGLSLPSGSPLAALEDTPIWQRHSKAFDATFQKVEDRQLSKVKDWAKANLPSHRDTLFYFFSGPDFLYANAFFPDATTYVLAGLEPTGPVPDVSKLSKGAIAGALGALQTSSRSLLNVSFFITARMKTELRASQLSGTLPVLYVFLARSGKVISDVELIQVDEKGAVQAAAVPAKKGVIPGAKITFASPGGPTQTLFYFSTDLSNAGVKTSGLLPFCENLGDGDGFVKSASYLLHGGNFSRLRNFLLAKSKLILEDDTGIPVALFGPKWELHPFGHYLGPIPVFAGQYQSRLAALFRKGNAKPIDFGLGYRWQPQASNLLLAIKQEPPTQPEPANKEKPAGKDEVSKNPAPTKTPDTTKH